jgi:tripeptide aminopeptidase
MLGDDIITADGTTLLGSDDKAGIAEILTMVDTLRQNPEIQHGRIAIAFTPDEETAPASRRSTSTLRRVLRLHHRRRRARHHLQRDVARPNGDRHVHRKEYPSRDGQGRDGQLDLRVRRFRLASAAGMLPETTEGRAGFVHPWHGSIEVEESILMIGLRDFDTSGLVAQERLLHDIASETRARYPDVRIGVEVEDFYRNIQDVLKDHPQLIDDAIEATRRAGLTPVIAPIRGGTDGAQLTFRGLPTPDLFTGGYNFHGKLEFNSRRGLEKTTEMLVHLVQIVAAAD